MDLGSFLLILALALAAGLVISIPLRNQGRGGKSGGLAGEDNRAALDAERGRIVEAIAELDFDHAMGKVPAEDYPARRAALVEEGAQVLRRLDGLEKAAATPQTNTPADIEDAELEGLIAAHARQRRERAGGFCPRCGKPAQKNDLFCARCGAGLGGG